MVWALGVVHELPLLVGAQVPGVRVAVEVPRLQDLVEQDGWDRAKAFVRKRGRKYETRRGLRFADTIVRQRFVQFGWMTGGMGVAG